MALTISVSEIVEKANNPLLAKHESWERVLLGDIATVQNGFAFKSSQFTTDEGMPLIRIRDVGEDGTDTYYKGEYGAEFVVQAGDLLVGMDGDFKCARWRGSNGLLNQRVCRIILHSEIYHPKFIDYTLPGYLKAINDVTSSVTVKHLSSKSVKEIPLPLPPFDVQTRIVAEVEKQFSRLDEAVANLKRVKANLKRYKAAVLKAAVEGKLTEGWRRQHLDVEPADKLLERILAERRKAAGKGKYKEPVAPDTSGLPELPAGWVWARLGALPVEVFDGPFGSNLKSSDYVASGVRVIRLENIGSREFIDEKTSFVTEEKYEQLKKHTVRNGDIIFSSFIANETRVVMLPDHIEKAINKADCFCVRINNDALNKQYLETFLATRTAYEQLVGEVHGATRPRINTTQLKDCLIPVPPVGEQAEIVARLSAMLSVAAVAEVEIERNQLRADRLRQSILKQAFSGQLVPQDPNDEPASVLLERIRANSPSPQLLSPRAIGRKANPLPVGEGGRRPGEGIPVKSTTNDFPSLDAVLTAILGRMQPGKEYSRADLADPLGLSTGRWNMAIQELKRRGLVWQVGEKRGARYAK